MGSFLLSRKLLCTSLAFNSNSQDKTGYAAVTKQNNKISMALYIKKFIYHLSKINLKCKWLNHPLYGTSAIHDVLIYVAKSSQHKSVSIIRKTKEKRNRRIAEGLEAIYFTYAHISLAITSLMALPNCKGVGNIVSYMPREERRDRC